ncbi:MAG TPA: type II CAAX endopeptidase family protein [Terriglobales bacterium]|nr:type II CAAX endopeptidase family protein [Terriglobales bacterium]
MEAPAPLVPGRHISRKPLVWAAVIYCLLLVAFWFAALYFDIPARIHGHLPSSFVAFALLLAPYWFFGFGLAEWLRTAIENRFLRIALPGSLVIPYLDFSLARSEFRWLYAVALFGIPVFAAALFELTPPASKDKFCWQDFVLLWIFFLPIEFGLLGEAFPYSGLSVMPKFLLVDAALYAYLVVRGLERVGYDFRVRWRDLGIGVRECAFYAPIVISLGIWLRFLHPHRGVPSVAKVFGALLITFIFVAIPEELFFRGLLQNLLKSRIGHPLSLFVAAVLFGLSHFNKPGPFNWRYVLLGSIAGIFYGRAWRDRRRILSSATTHTLVDVIWSLWFR